MSRTILITRRDWLQEDGVTFRGDVGFWSLPLTNMLDSRPQFPARALDNRDPASPIFSGDLGTERWVGLIGFAGLRAGAMGTMRVQLGLDPTFATNTFDSGIVSTWPYDSDGGLFDAWDRWTLNGIYNEDEYTALGMPRVFLPSQRVRAQYFHVEFLDPTAQSPLEIGCFSLCDVWEPPLNFKYDWEYTPVDESVITRMPRGASYVDEAGIRRRLNLGFDQLDEDEVFARGFGLMLRTGRSTPFWVMPYTDDTQIKRWEKYAVYGFVSTDSVMSNPFVGRFAIPITIEQLY